MATEILADKTAITHRALEIVLELYQGAIAARGLFTLVAAGGSTPKSLYQALALQSLDWPKVHVFWGDERYVPVTDPQSNQGMTRTAWLDRVPIPTTNIHPIPTEDPDPAIAAASYEQKIKAFFAPGEPVFDLILLGIGDDGHTASLFPYTDALAVGDRLVTVGRKDNQPRITFTYPLINQARQILFLVDGAAKAPAIAAILGADLEVDIQKYPAQGVSSAATWLLSQEAAAMLQQP